MEKTSTAYGSPDLPSRKVLLLIGRFPRWRADVKYPGRLGSIGDHRLSVVHRDRSASISSFWPEPRAISWVPPGPRQTCDRPLCWIGPLDESVQSGNTFEFVLELRRVRVRSGFGSTDLVCCDPQTVSRVKRRRKNDGIVWRLIRWQIVTEEIKFTQRGSAYIGGISTTANAVTDSRYSSSLLF